MEETVSGDLIQFYFTEKPQHAAEGGTSELCNAAITAILDAPKIKPGPGVSTDSAPANLEAEPDNESDNQSPVLVYIQNVASFMQPEIPGLRVLAALRDAVRKRRASGAEIALLLDASSRWQDTLLIDEDRLIEVLDVKRAAVVTIPPKSSCPGDDVKRDSYLAMINTRRLMRSLQPRIPCQPTPDVFQPFSEWFSAGCHGWPDSWSMSLWPKTEIERAATQISGRIWRRAQLILEDVQTVLLRMERSIPHRGRHDETAGAEKLNKSKPSWDHKVEKVKTSADEYELQLISSIINPGMLMTETGDIRTLELCNAV
jgi:hypothetical protein